MLDSLKQAGRNLGHEISRGWDSVSEGWREMLHRSGSALTHFSRRQSGKRDEDSLVTGFPSWSVLAGEVEETEKELVVRVELPGMEKEDCRIAIEDDVLYVSGEKQQEREAGDSTYHVMERAYGAFQRVIPLPRSVDADKAEARYKNGVLTVRLPKLGGEKAKHVRVS